MIIEPETVARLVLRYGPLPAAYVKPGPSNETVWVYPGRIVCYSPWDDVLYVPGQLDDAFQAQADADIRLRVPNAVILRRTRLERYAGPGASRYWLDRILESGSTPYRSIMELEAQQTLDELLG